MKKDKYTEINKFKTMNIFDFEEYYGVLKSDFKDKKDVLEKVKEFAQVDEDYFSENDIKECWICLLEIEKIENGKVIKVFNIGIVEKDKGVPSCKQYFDGYVII